MATKETQANTPSRWEQISREGQVLWRQRYYPRIGLFYKNPDVTSYLYPKTLPEIDLFDAYACREIILADRSAIKKQEVRYWVELLNYVGSLIKERGETLSKADSDHDFGIGVKELSGQLRKQASIFVGKFLATPQK